MSVFDTVEVLAEFSKAIRHGLIALESLHDLEGVDQDRVSTLADSVRHVHAETADYVASLIGSAALHQREQKKAA